MAGAQAPAPNLSPEEIEALGELSRRQDIVIKPADKGSAVVIMDKTQYVQEGLRQLGDEAFYSKVSGSRFSGVGTLHRKNRRHFIEDGLYPAYPEVSVISELGEVEFPRNVEVVVQKVINFNNDAAIL